MKFENKFDDLNGGVKARNFMDFKESINDYIQFSGSVKVIVEEDNGETWVHHEKHNLIVNLARKILAHAIAESPNEYKITKLKLGTMGHNGTDILDPVEPTVADTDLNDTNPYIKPLSSFQYLPIGQDTSVKFIFILDRSEANGSGSGVVAYTEAGLFTDSDLPPSTLPVMFSRETFPAVVKNDNRRITFEWTIIF